MCGNQEMIRGWAKPEVEWNREVKKLRNRLKNEKGEALRIPESSIASLIESLTSSKWAVESLV